MGAKLEWFNPETQKPFIGLASVGKRAILRVKWSQGKEPVEVTMSEESTWWSALKRKLKGLGWFVADYPVTEKPVGSRVSDADWTTAISKLFTTNETVWRFNEKANNAWSPSLRVTASGVAWVNTRVVEGKTAVPIELTGGYAGVNVGIKTEIPAGRETTIDVGQLVTEIDPSVQCRVIGPFPYGDSGLLNFILEQEPEIDKDVLVAEFRSAFGQEIFSPKNLTVRLAQSDFVVSEHEPQDVQLIISAEVETRAVVAVLATIDGDPTNTVLSDLIEIGVVPQPVESRVSVGA